MMRPIGCVVMAVLAGCAPAPEKKADAKLPPAPETFKVKFETSKGDFVVQVHREWAPIGVERFWELVQRKFYQGAPFYRVLPRYVAQWGVAGDPAINAVWANAVMADDPPQQSNKTGRISFAAAGKRSRTTQVFVNLRDSPNLDKEGLVPFGEVVEGLNVLERLYGGYGDLPPRGNGPKPDLLQRRGNEYLEKEFPRMDYIKRATIE